MKRLLSVLIMCLLLIQLSACGLNSEKFGTGTLRLNNPIDKSVTEIKVDSDNIYLPSGTMLAFQSSLSVTEMAESLAKKNPDYTFEALDDQQILMTDTENGNHERTYILITKNVVDADHNPISDLYIVKSESDYVDRVDIKLYFPYHLTNNYFVFNDNNGSWTLEDSLPAPFSSYPIGIRDSKNAMGDLVTYYESCGYLVKHIGTNYDGGIITVTPTAENATPYKIIVMQSGDNCAIQFGVSPQFGMTPDAANKLQEFTVINDYFEALNAKDYQSYLACFDNYSDDNPDAFFNNVKSAELVSGELIWSDASRNESICKLRLYFISEDNKQMGSYGTGEINALEYWTIKANKDGKFQIKGKYSYIGDSIRTLDIYQEVQKNEKDNLVDWLFSITPTE